MYCPECLSEETAVSLGRHEEGAGIAGGVYMRRRKCLRCGHRWTTVEWSIDPLNISTFRAVCEVAAKLGRPVSREEAPPDG